MAKAPKTTRKAPRKTPDQPTDKADKKAVAEAQFAEADRRGNPAHDGIAAGLDVRGY